jgi:regulator of sigma E protease
MTLTLWAAAVVALLGVLILAHELGHFLVAKLFGVKVLRFSFGFGPRLFGFTAGSTEYRLSLFPLGGYLRLLGEDPSEVVPEHDYERALFARPLWQRYAIVVAGPLFNLILPVGIYFIHYVGPEDAALADHRHGDRRPARGQGGAFARRSRRNRGRQVRSLLGRAGRNHRRFAGQDHALRHPARQRLRRTRRHHRDQRAQGAAQPERNGGMDWRLAALPAARGRHHRSDLARGAGRPANLRLHHFGQRLAGFPLGRVRSRRGPRGRLSAAHHLFARHPFGRALRPRGNSRAGRRRGHSAAVLAPSGGRRYDTGIQSSELFVYSVEPGSPADRIGLRRGDQLLELDGQPILHWNILRQRWPPNPSAPSASYGPRQAAFATRPPSSKSCAPSWMPTARKSSAWSSAPPIASPGRPRIKFPCATDSSMPSGTP